MDIRPVSCDKFHFNGYVDTSVKKYIIAAVENEYRRKNRTDTLNDSSFNSDNIIFNSTLSNLYERGGSVLKAFEDFMKKLHPKTKLVLEDTDNGIELMFKNPVSDFSVSCVKSESVENSYVDDAGMIVIPKLENLTPKKEATIGDISTLEDYLYEFTKIMPQEIDKIFLKAERDKLLDNNEYESFPGIFDNVRRKWLEGKIAKFESEIFKNAA